MGTILAIIAIIIVAAVGGIVLLSGLYATGQPRRVAFMLACWLVVILGAGWFFGR